MPNSASLVPSKYLMYFDVSLALFLEGVMNNMLNVRFVTPPD